MMFSVDRKILFKYAIVQFRKLSTYICIRVQTSNNSRVPNYTSTCNTFYVIISTVSNGLFHVLTHLHTLNPMKQLCVFYGTGISRYIRSYHGIAQTTTSGNTVNIPQSCLQISYIICMHSKQLGYVHMA